MSCTPPVASNSFRCGGPFVSATLHSFGGEIIVKDALATGEWEDSDALKKRFQKAGAVGIDFEWKPDKSPATNHPISLVQLATEDLALLIRTNTCHILPQWVRDILADPKKAKVTIGFDVSDHAKLQLTFGLECNNVIDLYEISKKNRNVPRGGLKRIAHHFGYFLRKDKKISMSDWSAVEPLSDIQIHYAADDAFFPLLLVAQLGGLADAGVDFEHLKENVKAVDNKDRYDAMVKKRASVIDTLKSDRSHQSIDGWVATSRVDASGIDRDFLLCNRDVFEWRRKDKVLQIRLRAGGLGFDESSSESEEDDGEGDFGVLKKRLSQRLVAEWVPENVLTGSSSRRERFRQEALSHSEEIEACFDGEFSRYMFRLRHHPLAADRSVVVGRVARFLGMTSEQVEARIEEDAKLQACMERLETAMVDTASERSVVMGLVARFTVLEDGECKDKEYKRLLTQWIKALCDDRKDAPTLREEMKKRLSEVRGKEGQEEEEPRKKRQRQVRQGTQQLASATSKFMEDLGAAGSLPAGSTAGLRTCQEVSFMLESYIDDLGAQGNAVRRLPGLVESLNRWNDEIALGNDAKQRFIDTPEGMSPTQLQSIPPNQITALTFRQVFLRSKCLEKLVGLCARDTSLRVLMRDLASVANTATEEDEEITVEKMFRFMMYRLLSQCLRGQPTVWQQLLDSVMQTSEDVPVSEELVLWLERMITALKLDWKDDHYHDRVLNTMRRLKADLYKEGESPVSATGPQMPSASIATLTCQLHRIVSAAKERRVKSLAEREATMKEVAKECETKMLDIDKEVDSQATEITELEEQVKSMHTEVHEQLEALKPNEEEIEEQMKTLEEEKEKLEKRLMEIISDEFVSDEELDTLSARKNSIEQAEGQLLRSDKDTSEHFENRIAEQQLRQRQEADLKGYIATFKSIVLVGNDELTSVSGNQVAEMDAKMIKTKDKAEAGAREFLLKEAAYLAVLKAEMESPDSPGEHVLQLLKQADKAWVTVDKFGRQYSEYIEAQPDSMAALQAEPHKLEAMERIHRGMSEDVGGAPVMSIATPRSSDGGSSSPQVQPPPPPQKTMEEEAVKTEAARIEPAPKPEEQAAAAPTAEEDRKAVPPPPPPPRTSGDSKPSEGEKKADETSAEARDDDKLFADLLH
ncbi:hypothetical protein FOL47_003177 [Perkinsus chesapeaki]|uniref:3'-5' exonuclease domain-containing protein n=1 Tax=Perkinsus chesapeaki TaxID=330153 RepID=A0A7J6M965_PERCH|nr:hypothetical protein FOL47_003177 [Perkinsus chesapeaki]